MPEPKGSDLALAFPRPLCHECGSQASSVWFVLEFLRGINGPLRCAECEQKFRTRRAVPPRTSPATSLPDST